MKIFRAILVVTAVSACVDQPTSPSSTGIIALRSARGTGPTDPTAAWKIPLDDAALSLRSDGRYAEGTNSVYANGVCNVSAKIFATAQFSNSGDATMQTSKATGGKCGRTLTLVYPDGFRESIPSFNNLNRVQNTSYSIAEGATVRRRLVISPSGLANNPSRCGKLHFGGAVNGVGSASDSVLVTRIDRSTWHVQSQSAPDNRAVCEATGQVFNMQVSFVVVSSYPLP